MVLALEREPRQTRRWGTVVAHAWGDDAFRRRLLAEPAGVLREEGIDVPAGVAVRVIESENAEAGEDETCFWLPPRPHDDDLVEDDLGLAPGVFDGGVAFPTRATKPTKTAAVAARHATGSLTEHDLGLPPGAFNGGTFPTRRTKPTTVCG
jgi:hypothetical protein